MPFFDFNGVRLYYEIKGNGQPLLLINGLGGDMRQWEFIAPFLKDAFRLISYDIPLEAPEKVAAEIKLLME